MFPKILRNVFNRLAVVKSGGEFAENFPQPEAASSCNRRTLAAVISRERTSLSFPSQTSTQYETTGSYPYSALDHRRPGRSQNLAARHAARAYSRPARRESGGGLVRGRHHAGQANPRFHERIRGSDAD